MSARALSCGRRADRTTGEGTGTKISLRNEEIVRLKYELGYSVTGVGADIYISYSAVFDRAVQPYLVDLGTTSSTSVTAAVGGARTTIVVAANPLVTPNSTQSVAFVVGSNVVVGTGPSKETSIIEAISGLSLTLTLANAHTGTYPVLVEGAEQIVRDCFDRLDAIKAEMRDVAPVTAGIAALVGDIELYGGGHARGRSAGRSKFEDLVYQRKVARDDLAGALGIPNLNGTRGGGGSFELY